MHLNPHLELRDKHAFLSPSSYHWLNYDPDRLKQIYLAQLRKEEGTKLHALAKELINLGVMLPSTEETLNMYVNDCIVCHMTPEQPLFYSWNCYGTADAIGLDSATLRIFDLKTGMTKANIKQLLIYAALFFLEYGQELDISPHTVETELRIYQLGKIEAAIPDPSEILQVMNHIVVCDDIINRTRGDGRSWRNEY